jgi:hypothetical protein
LLNIYPFKKNLTFQNYKIVNFGCFEGKKKPTGIKEPPFPIMSKTSKNQWLNGKYLRAMVIYQNWLF